MLPKIDKRGSLQVNVRPKVEYSSCVWDPHKKDVEKIEMVQQRGARFVTNTPTTDTQASMVQSQGLRNLAGPLLRRGGKTADWS